MNPGERMGHEEAQALPSLAAAADDPAAATTQRLAVGTKVQANASKHKARSRERMYRAEKELEREINAVMRKAEILVAVRLPRSGCPGGSALRQGETWR
jgi:hypothetical protein